VVLSAIISGETTQSTRSFSMGQDLLPKAYEPAEIEKRWYAFWEEKQLFHADENKTVKEY